MIDKPKRKPKLTNQDRQLPNTIQELINRYDLENNDVYNFLDYLVETINQKEFVTVVLNEDYTLTSTNLYEMLPLTRVETKAGTKLTVDNNGQIVIGEGVNHVRISGQAYFYQGSLDRYKNVAIYKNDARQSTTNTHPSIQYLHINTQGKIIDVQEGDLIKLGVCAEQGDVIKAYNDGTFLTVEVID